MNAAGFFVEEHKQQVAGDALYYHLGKFIAGKPEWGGSVRYDSGYDPSVAIRTDGLIVDAHSNAGTLSPNPKLYYRIGKIDPRGGADQTIQWYGGAVQYDGGYYPKVSINDDGRVVEAHKSSSFISKLNLVYRLGHLVATEGGYRIDWDSGKTGISYGSGDQPQIAINNVGEFVEVHADRRDLHYRRGYVTRDRLAFLDPASNGRYITGEGIDPRIAITGSGLALETHTYPTYRIHIASLIARFNRVESTVIPWTYPQFVADLGTESSVGVNGSYAIEVNAASGNNMEFNYGAIDCPAP